MHTEFYLPEDLDFEHLRSRLQKHLRLIAEPQQTVYRTYYDSFDWRLYAENTRLVRVCDNTGDDLVWQTLEGKPRCSRLTLNNEPRFAWDLPAGRFRDLLAPVLEMRELVPIARIKSTSHTLRIVDKRKKTLAYLIVEKYSLLGQQVDSSAKLTGRVRVIPLKGFTKAYDQVIKQLRQQGLAPADNDLMLEACSLCGKSPGSYSSKLNLKLTPSMRADEATKVILRRLLYIMLQNEAGTRSGSDSEFLHDFRVAIRRTRSALTQIKGVFPETIVNRYKSEFAWLGQITTPTRDLDVYLLGFDKYRDSLPADFRADIEPLHEFLIRHQMIENKALVKTLDSARYQRLVKNWNHYLEQPVNLRSTLENAHRSSIEVACERIWRIYQRVTREGNAIHSETPAEALHELRKTCKKLRYLIEFFQSLYPSSDIKEAIRVLKTLQDNLGDFQDYEVQVDTLKKFSHQMVTENMAPPDTLLVMGMLMDGLVRRQNQAREEFAGRFASFSQQDHQHRFRKLFATGPSAGKPAGPGRQKSTTTESKPN